MMKQVQETYLSESMTGFIMIQCESMTGFIMIQ